MKTLYSKSKEEEEVSVTVATAKLIEPSGEKDGASTSTSKHEEVIVEEVVE